jgi:hypothetical protein
MQRESSLHRALHPTLSVDNNRRQNAENLTLIWYDIPVSENTENKNQTMFIEQFRHVINNIHVFNNVDECIDYITDVKHEIIFLIVTDSAVALNDLKQILNQVAYIHSIYIFRKDDSTDRHESSFTNNRKIRGTFSSITGVCTQLRKDTKRCEHNMIGFDVVSADNITNDKQEANFMYAQLLKECFLDIANNENNDITDLIEYCRLQYADNQHELVRIDELERDYTSHSPIWWYTRDGFLYKMLNKALRIQDIETLYAMRIFTKQLHEQLVHLHHYQQNTPIGSISLCQTILYRGQQMPSNEFNMIKNNQGGLLSINSFLSTSENKDLAVMFVGDNSSSDDAMTAVLLEIRVMNADDGTPPFANVSELSYFGEAENEVLFSMGNAFRIENVTKQHSDGDFWLVPISN